MTQLRQALRASANLSATRNAGEGAAAFHSHLTWTGRNNLELPTKERLLAYYGTQPR